MREAFVGFDSAWAVKNSGAIAYAVFDGDDPDISQPQLADFADASRVINKLRQECDNVLVAIDQPIIVPNPDRSRPVDLVARSLMSRLKSAAQSASRNKESMFGDDSPVWGFIRSIGLPRYDGRTTELSENRVFLDFEGRQKRRRSNPSDRGLSRPGLAGFGAYFHGPRQRRQIQSSASDFRCGRLAGSLQHRFTLGR